MKKILYVSTKETIELTYPSWLDSIMIYAWRYIKVRTVKPLEKQNKAHIIIIDEFANTK